MKHKIYDVIIVGAGASGVACAAELHKAGVSFLLLEARSRIGGRIYSMLDDKYQIPIELGAEFIHGTPQNIFDLYSEFGIGFYDVPDIHLELKKDRLIEGKDFWGAIEAFMKKLNTKKKSDQSIEDFLDRQSNLRPHMKPIFRAFMRLILKNSEKKV